MIIINGYYGLYFKGLVVNKILFLITGFRVYCQITRILVNTVSRSTTQNKIHFLQTLYNPVLSALMITSCA